MSVNKPTCAQRSLNKPKGNQMILNELKWPKYPKMGISQLR